MAEILEQNKNLTETLQKAKEQVIELQRQMANHKNDKASLAVGEYNASLDLVLKLKMYS